jgi:late competence protein required for DNA uptake (superfamily II DNA/RNA helicase)
MITIFKSLKILSVETITLVEKLKISGTLDFSEYKNLLEATYHLLSSKEDDFYNIGLFSICHICEFPPKEIFLLQLLNDCIVSSRVFLYKEMLPEQIIVKHSFLDLYVKEFYTLDTGTILTKDQKKLINLFNKHKRLIVSAPTSFGKSRIIEEIIIQNKYSNIAIILPTIALLSETYLRFNINSFIKGKYNLINSLGLAETISKNRNNIFILTPEKMDMLLDEKPKLNIDFFVIDEIYKIQDDQDRKSVFSNCLYRLSKMKNDFYLIGPYFDDFSPKFRNNTNSFFKKFDSEIVQKDVYNLFKMDKGEEYTIGNKSLKKKVDNKLNLRDILKNIEGQSIVYHYRKDYVENLSKDIIKILNRDENLESDLIDYISESISPEWSLIKALKKGVAFHHGAVPRYIQTEIIDSFNNQELDVIVCTTTITEGVNTSAKNVILYSNALGKKENLLTGFEVKNIKGRAGRFRVHFIGRVFYFHEVNENDKDIITVDFYDNDDLKAEDIIQIEKGDLNNKNLERREEIERLLAENKIPLSLLKQNKYISIHKQISLINFLRTNPIFLQLVYFTGTHPDKNQLGEIFNLTREHLFNERDYNDKRFIYWELSRLLKYYVYHKPSIRELIKEQRNSEYIDSKIRSAFNLITHYFEFAFPRYFKAFENLYNFVYNEYHDKSQAINLKYLITLLEFGFVKENEIALKEAGLPNDIIRKVSSSFSDCNSLEQVRMKFRTNPYILKNLSAFEQKIFRRYI